MLTFVTYLQILYELLTAIFYYSFIGACIAEVLRQFGLEEKPFH